jgi:hypothetical protein
LALILCVMLCHHAGAVPLFGALDRATPGAVTLPAGTRLPIVLDTPVASDTSRVEQSIAGHLSRDIAVNGVVVVPAGSEVLGAVTSARRSGRVKGRAFIGIRFTTLVPKGSRERYRIQTAAIGRMAPATKKADAIKIGAPAAGGALIGALAGGKKGALIGAGVGGGAGTAVVLTTRGKEVGIARGTQLMLRLASPVAVRVRA